MLGVVTQLPPHTPFPGPPTPWPRPTLLPTLPPPSRPAPIPHLPSPLTTCRAPLPALPRPHLPCYPPPTSPCPFRSLPLPHTPCTHPTPPSPPTPCPRRTFQSGAGRPGCLVHAPRPRLPPGAPGPLHSYLSLHLSTAGMLHATAPQGCSTAVGWSVAAPSPGGLECGGLQASPGPDHGQSCPKSSYAAAACRKCKRAAAACLLTYEAWQRSLLLTLCLLWRSP